LMVMMVHEMIILFILLHLGYKIGRNRNGGQKNLLLLWAEQGGNLGQ